MKNTIICANSLNFLPTIESESIDCCVTSPPYYGLRNYNVKDQIGLEDNYHEYVNNITKIFSEVKRILKKSGVLWLNMGDTYVGGGRGGNPKHSKHYQQETNFGSLSMQGVKLKVSDLPAKSLIGIPWRVAFALQNSGWILRQDIVWNKTNCMPESVCDRCTKSHEYIFMFVKSKKYYFDHNEMLEKATVGWNGSKFNIGKTLQHKLQGRGPGNWKVRSAGVIGEYENRGSPSGPVCNNGFRNKRSVWNVPTKAFNGAHFATFPVDLILPCIKSTCPKDGTVLDPFSGSGTVALACKITNRNYIGIELNEKYVEISNKRLLDYENNCSR